MKSCCFFVVYITVSDWHSLWVDVNKLESTRRWLRHNTTERICLGLKEYSGWIFCELRIRGAVGGGEREKRDTGDVAAVLSSSLAWIT